MPEPVSLCTCAFWRPTPTICDIALHFVFPLFDFRVAIGKSISSGVSVHGSGKIYVLGLEVVMLVKKQPSYMLSGC